MQLLGSILNKLFGFAPDTAAFTIRESRIGDRDEVFTLANASRPESPARLLASHCDLNRCWVGPAQIVRTWVAVDQQGKIIGVAACIEDLGAVALADIIVDPLWRRRGVGSALLREILDLAEGCEVPILTLVRGSDLAGLAWLCQRGFEPRKHGPRAIVYSQAYPGEACEEGIPLARRCDAIVNVRIAE
jgi:GNAT superfamily N-acetyltransferase